MICIKYIIDNDKINKMRTFQYAGLMINNTCTVLMKAYFTCKKIRVWTKYIYNEINKA